jgi:FtsP/CotA-like multicopper oxidase with cupredoxin domain
VNIAVRGSRELVASCAKVLVALSLATGCGTSSSPSSAPEVDPLALVPVHDENPDPNVVEVSLEAREGMKTYGTSAPTPVWTYDGSVPGPFIDAKVGDRVIIKFKSSLPEPTTIHWHGIRLPAAMDGTTAMQSPIPPGGTFRYEYVFKDAGLYWYHPHMRSDVQVQKGLHGAIRVRSPNEPVVDVERVLMLDDVRLKADGTLAEYLDDTAKMMGREGNTLLVNGITDATIPMRSGSSIRLRLVNVANGRFFNLRLPGHTWRVIGTDGGLLAKPYDTEKLLIAPGERYDVMLIASGAPTTVVDLMNDAYDRGHQSGDRPSMTVAHVRFTEDAPLTGRSLPDAFPGVAPLPAAYKSVPIVLNEGLRNGELVFTVNDAVFPNVPPVMVENGGLRMLDVKNDSEMDHPFHLHGFFFQILEKNGVAQSLESSGNKDTAILPAKSSMKLVSHFDEPGHWMYHCHILEHAEGGMMGEVHVE